MLWAFITGLVVGWIANMIIRGGGYGLIVNLILGLIGALLGSWIVRLFSAEETVFDMIIAAIIGSAILIWLVTALSQRKEESEL